MGSSMRRASGSGKRRRLDIGKIKLVIVTLVATITAFCSGLTGVTGQVAFAPMLTWMLGFGAEKAQGTALRFTAAAACACVLGVWIRGPISYHAPGLEVALTYSALPSGVIWRALLLFFGATLGAIGAKSLTPPAEAIGRRRVFQGAGICIGIYMAAQAAHLTGEGTAQLYHWRHPLAYFAMGLVAGGLTQALGLASGVLVVPTLYYFGGCDFRQSVLLSLIVIGIAALLPAWSYGRRGLVDTRYGIVSIVGALVGGMGAGYLLPGIAERVQILLFALFAMFFSAREIARLAAEGLSQPPPSRVDLS